MLLCFKVSLIKKFSRRSKVKNLGETLVNFVEKKNLWAALEKLVRDFRRLFDNKTHFMAIYNNTNIVPVQAAYDDQVKIILNNYLTFSINNHGHLLPKLIKSQLN